MLSANGASGGGACCISIPSLSGRFYSGTVRNDRPVGQYLKGTRMTPIDTRAGRVAYRESGSGPTVLLLPATLHDRHDFDPIVDTLSSRYRTIAVDWPGHG